MYRLLIDTCVWLDLAKDHRLHSLIGVLQRLLESNTISLLVPQTVVDEFQRNKARVAEDCCRSLSSVFKRVKAAVREFGDPDDKDAVLAHLDNVDHQIPLLGEGAIHSIGRIEQLMNAASTIHTSDSTKLLAAERAIEAKAPFHRNRNGMGDAIIFETYTACLAKRQPTEDYAFVTHNTEDFSDPHGDKRLPHPDLQLAFANDYSFYFISLREALSRVDTELLAEIIEEEEWTQEPRRLTEILEALDELLDKIWYGRHGARAYAVETGKIRIVDENDYPTGQYDPNVIRKDIWDGALKAAARFEEEYGIENLGPWSDFEWGMLSGKLSALRWMLGDDWDMLDT
ncbi:MAG: PIN domain-containing protein [Planctomycetaceae bacterium]